MITHHYINKDEYDKDLKLNGSCLKYYSVKAMRRLYPKGGYLVNGGIGKGLKNRQGEVLIHEQKQEYYTLHYNKLLYGISGYIAIGDDNYLAVIKSRKLRNLIVVLITMLVICVTTLGLAKLLNNDGLDPMAKDYTPSTNLVVDTDPDHIAIPGYKEIKMYADTDTAYMALWNPPSNPCYFRFTITIRDTNEKLYESGLVAPGKAITEIKFNRAIKEGKYALDVKIETFQLKDKDKRMNGGVSRVNLIAYKQRK